MIDYEVLKLQLLKVVINIALFIAVMLIAKAFLNNFSKFTQKTIDSVKGTEREKQVTTTMTVVRSAARYATYFLVIIFAVNILGGFNLSNTLLTAGVGTIILTLGVQNLFTDVVSGVLLVFDKQFEVGDFVKIGEYEGIVKAISLRATYLQIGGKKVIIPNGQIKDVVNYNEFVPQSIIIPAPYGVDSKTIMDILEEVCAAYYEDNKDKVIEKPLVLGINEFNKSSVDYAIYAKCVPLKHYSVPRDIRMLVKNSFDSKNISIPFTQIDIHTK